MRLKRGSFVVLNILGLATILYVLFAFQNVSDLLMGSAKFVSAMEFSKDMSEDDLKEFIGQVLNEGTSEVVEFKDGYHMYLENKQSDSEELKTYLDEKNKEYTNLVSTLKISQWVVAVFIIVDIYVGVNRFKQRRKVKVENIS